MVTLKRNFYLYIEENVFNLILHIYIHVYIHRLKLYYFILFLFLTERLYESNR